MQTLDLMVSLQDEAHRCHEKLLGGASQVLFTEVPDHVNVGDSAILLGLLAFFRRAGIRVVGASSVYTAGRAVFRSQIPVVIQGGGNFGGLYPPYEEFRQRLARELPGETLLVQAPQSVHFVDDATRDLFESGFARRPNTRLAVRDTESADVVSSMPGVLLSPDSAQVLGPIEAPGPSQDVLVLARRDIESRGGQTRDSVDWPSREGALETAAARYRLYQRRALPFAPVFANPSPQRWESIASRRLQRGLAVLALGETIVTDRLHAMVLGRLLGRRVIAIDNSTGKLSAYARTWYAPGESEDEFILATSFDEAMDRV